MIQQVAFRLAALSVAASIGVGGQTLQLPPNKTLIGSAEPVAKWEHGRLLAFDFGSAAIRAFDRTGTQVMQHLVSIPGAARVVIYDIAAAPDGSLAIAGGAMASDTEGVALLAWLSADGSARRIARTGQFVTKFICFSPDGNLWALGRDKSFDREEHPTYDTVRVYGNQGTLIRSLLPIESFSEYMDLDYIRRSAIHPSTHAQLKASKDRVGLYSRSAGAWIEFTLDGKVRGRWKALHPAGSVQHVSVALTDDGSVFATSQMDQLSRSDGLSPRSATYALSRSADTWIRINDSALLDATNRNVFLYGADGAALVMSSRMPEFVWVETRP